MIPATCAIALDEAVRDEIIKSGSKVAITAVGAGLVGAAIAHQF